MNRSQTDHTLSGLTDEQIVISRQQHGENKVAAKKQYRLMLAVKSAIHEPMVALLALASTLYFIHGDLSEGIFLLAAIVLVFSISHYQETRSKKALEALKRLSQPKSKVIRNYKTIEIATEEIVVDDLIIMDEGSLIPADATIIQSNDFSVNESTLTGESIPIYKDESEGRNFVYRGTLVATGLAICKVIHVGAGTTMGEIEKRLQEIPDEKTPLQLQISNFVKKMAAFGVSIFAIIWFINIYRSRQVVDSLLNSLTLAMSILPEEIPVAFATFMALGAWRLMRLGVIVKQTRTVETLGAATVICIDKTGTITKNEMTLDRVYVHGKNQIFNAEELREAREVVTLAMWASEPMPFDPMEKVLHDSYSKICDHDLRSEYQLVHEYPLSGKPPIMTHVFQNRTGNRIIAVKGAPEGVIKQAMLSGVEIKNILIALKNLTSKGYRVLAVGESSWSGEYPLDQSELKFMFKGLVAFYDPPKENIHDVLQKFYKAGIRVKVITGDNSVTTSAVAAQIGLVGADQTITSDVLMQLDARQFNDAVSKTTIFARMFPDAKLKVIQTLKAQGEIVAMTGDGVNDGPALKAANIGIAMGKKGSEIAKQASALILADDDLDRMVSAIAVGRKIYSNLKKAIQYIISIHIPIILMVFLPLTMDWSYPVIFSPMHIIFLELIMGPTCSIIYENEPMEKNAMEQRPRPFTDTFFNLNELSRSIVQGLAITFGLILIYFYETSAGKSLPIVTSTVFIGLIAANIMLTLVNRSFYYSILSTLRNRNALITLIISITAFLSIIIFSVRPLRSFFGFEIPSANEIWFSCSTGAISVLWFEIYKFYRRAKDRD